MSSRTILGNDPFQRGAAVRSPPGNGANEHSPPSSSASGSKKTKAVPGDGKRKTTTTRGPAQSASRTTRSKERKKGHSGSRRPLDAASPKGTSLAPAAGLDATSSKNRPYSARQDEPTAKSRGRPRYETPRGEPSTEEAPHADERREAEAGSGIRSTARRKTRAAGSLLDASPVDGGPARSLVGKMYSKWFRVEAEGLENIPSEGPVLLVCNHGGAFPWDALMVKMAVERARGPARAVRPLVDDSLFELPLIGGLLERHGAMRASEESLGKLLERNEVVAVFPEGIKGLGKSYASRYKMARFESADLVSPALRSSAPIIPVAILGSEDAHPVLFNVGPLTSFVRLRHLPITPTFPWLGLLGLVPVPVKWHMKFGSPRDIPGQRIDAATGQTDLTSLTEGICSSLQAMLDRLVASRPGMLRRIFS